MSNLPSSEAEEFFCPDSGVCVEMIPDSTLGLAVLTDIRKAAEEVEQNGNTYSRTYYKKYQTPYLNGVDLRGPDETGHYWLHDNGYLFDDGLSLEQAETLLRELPAAIEALRVAIAKSKGDR